MSFEPIQAVAGGDVRTCRLVKQSTTAYELLEADANERCVGVSTEGAQDAPIPSASANAASEDRSIRYHPVGSICLLEAGSGGWSPNDLLKSDADGKGVAAATTGTTLQWVSAIALETVADGEKGKVQVVSYPYRPAIV